MDLTIRINEYTKNGLLAYASARFDNAYRLDNIRLMMAQESGVKIVLPEYIKDGKAHEIFHPVNSDARERFDIAILTAYSNLLSQKQSETEFKDFSDKDFAVSYVRSTVFEKNNIIGLANVYFAGDFVLDGVRICEGQRGVFLNMPQSKHMVKENGRTVYNMDGTPKITYSDIFKPLTTDAYGHMYSEVMENYNVQVMMYENSVSVYLEDTGKVVKLPNFISNDDITTEDLIASNIGNGVNYDVERGMFSMSHQQYIAVRSTISNENYAYIANEKSKTAESERAEKKKSTRQKVSEKQKEAQQSKKADKTHSKTKEKSQDVEGR